MTNLLTKNSNLRVTKQPKKSFQLDHLRSNNQFQFGHTNGPGTLNMSSANMLHLFRGGNNSVLDERRNMNNSQLRSTDYTDQLNDVNFNRTHNSSFDDVLRVERKDIVYRKRKGLKKTAAVKKNDTANSLYETQFNIAQDGQQDGKNGISNASKISDQGVQVMSPELRQRALYENQQQYHLNNQESQVSSSLVTGRKGEQQDLRQIVIGDPQDSMFQLVSQEQEDSPIRSHVIEPIQMMNIQDQDQERVFPEIKRTDDGFINQAKSFSRCQKRTPSLMKKQYLQYRSISQQKNALAMKQRNIQSQMETPSKEQDGNQFFQLRQDQQYNKYIQSNQVMGSAIVGPYIQEPQMNKQMHIRQKSQLASKREIRERDRVLSIINQQESIPTEGNILANTQITDQMGTSNEIYQLENPDSLKNRTMELHQHLSDRDPKNATLQYVKFVSFFDAKQNAQQVQLNPNLQKMQMKNNKILMGKRQKSVNTGSTNFRAEYPQQNFNNHQRGYTNGAPDIAYNQFHRTQYNPGSATNVSGGKEFSLPSNHTISNMSQHPQNVQSSNQVQLNPRAARQLFQFQANQLERVKTSQNQSGVQSLGESPRQLRKTKGATRSSLGAGKEISVENQSSLFRQSGQQTMGSEARFPPDGNKTVGHGFYKNLSNDYHLFGPAFQKPQSMLGINKLNKERVTSSVDLQHIAGYPPGGITDMGFSLIPNQVYPKGNGSNPFLNTGKLLPVNMTASSMMHPTKFAFSEDPTASQRQNRRSVMKQPEKPRNTLENVTNQFYLQLKEHNQKKAESQLKNKSDDDYKDNATDVEKKDNNQYSKRSGQSVTFNDAGGDDAAAGQGAQAQDGKNAQGASPARRSTLGAADVLDLVKDRIKQEHAGFLHVVERKDVGKDEEEYKRSELFKKALSVLEMPPSSRSSSHINLLRECFEKELSGFFRQVKSLNEGLDDEVVNHFLAALKLHKLQDEGIVCDYGDKAREFFVILEGSVDVLVLDEEEVRLEPVEPWKMQRQSLLARRHQQTHGGKEDASQSSPRDHPDGEVSPLLDEHPRKSSRDGIIIHDQLSKDKESTPASPGIGQQLPGQKSRNTLEASQPGHGSGAGHGGCAVERALEAAAAEAKEAKEFELAEKQASTYVFTAEEYALEALIWALKNFDKIVWWAVVVEGEEGFTNEKGQPLKKDDALNTSQQNRNQSALAVDRRKDALYYNCPVAKEISDFIDQNPSLMQAPIEELRWQLHNQAKNASFRLHTALFEWLTLRYHRVDLITNIMRMKVYKNVKTLIRGMCFGELALLNLQRRAARIVTSSDSLFGVLDKKEYDRVLGKKMNDEFKSKIAFLKHFRMFKKLSDSRLQRLIYSMHISKEYKRGQVVFKEGSTDINGIYLVSSGEFEISRFVEAKGNSLSSAAADSQPFEPNPNKQKLIKKPAKQKMRVMIMGVHEILGLEELLLFKEQRQCTVTCYSQRARAYFINREDFVRLLKSFSFDDSVLHELALKRSINKQRLNQLKKGYTKIANECPESKTDAQCGHAHSSADRLSEMQGKSPDRSLLAAERRKAIDIGEVPDMDQRKTKVHSMTRPSPREKHHSSVQQRASIMDRTTNALTGRLASSSGSPGAVGISGRGLNGLAALPKQIALKGIKQQSVLEQGRLARGVRQEDNKMQQSTRRSSRD